MIVVVVGIYCDCNCVCGGWGVGSTQALSTLKGGPKAYPRGATARTLAVGTSHSQRSQLEIGLWSLLQVLDLEARPLQVTFRMIGACPNTRTHARTHTHTYARTHARTGTHTCTHAHPHTRAHTCTHVHIRLHDPRHSSQCFFLRNINKLKQRQPNKQRYHESHPIARVRSTPEGNTTLMFTDYSRYGICEALEDVKGGCGGTAPGRFTVHGLLSEVDSEGEYWYDHASEQLYIYPPTDMHLDGADVAVVDRGGSVLTAWHEGTFATLVNTSYVTIRDITVQSSVETLVTIAGCYRTTVGGCTLKNAAGGISLSGGHNNRIIGNDIYDMDGHVSSSGDESSTAASLVPTNNVIENNHITQVYLAGSTWSVQIKGVGDRFTRNLVYGKFSFALLDMDPRACKK